MTRSRMAVLALTAAGALTFLAACGSSASPATTSSTASVPRTSAVPAVPVEPAVPGVPASPVPGSSGSDRLRAQPKSGVTRITASNLGKLGVVLTETNGMTLYRFDKDVANPPTSNCNDACATAWPPLLASADQVEVSGVDRALVGTVVRKDGRKQITIAGWPVYLFAKDKAPGEANGQGLNGTWFAVTPMGMKAAAQAPAVMEDGGYQGGYGY